jgi:cytochrome b561
MSDVASGLPVPESLIPYLTGELKDYSSVQDSVYTFNIAFGVLVVIALALRMFVRLYLIRAAGADDGVYHIVEH